MRALLLPGIVTPAAVGSAPLLEALGDAVDARAKELEVYRDDEPPPEYSLALEVEGVLRAADEAGWDRFHLVGYSGGGAVATVMAVTRPERLASLALLEPAWTGRQGQSEAERAAREEFDGLEALPPDALMREFTRAQLAPGVAPPPLFPDFTAEVFEERHHFDPPHRAEPERLAASLVAHWRRAEPSR